MYFNNFVVALVAFFLSFGSTAQTNTDSSKTVPTYKRVAIPKPNAAELETLNEIGVDLTCGVIQRNDSLLLEISEYTLNKLESEGIQCTVIVENILTQHAQQGNELPQKKEQLKRIKVESRKKNRQNRTKERRTARRLRRNQLGGSD